MKEIIKGLKKLEKVLKTGEPLENHFKITTLEKVNKWETVRTKIKKKK